MRNRLIKRAAAVLLAGALISGSVLTLYADAASAPSGLTVQQMFQSPGSPITKGEFARLINAALGLKGGGGASFKDVPAENPYADDLATAMSTGYYVGDGLGNVNPDKVLSGAEAAVSVNFFLSAGMGFDMSKVSADASISVPEWAGPAASNLLDLTMVPKDLLEKQRLSVADAGDFAQALYVAVMFMGSPYDASQASLKDDFYAYTNRQFLATAAITPGNNEVSNFTIVNDKVKTQISSIISGIVSDKNLTPGSDKWKINEIYSMYMDNDARTKSLEELTPILNDIRSAKTVGELDAVTEKYVDIISFMPFYSLGFASDAKADARTWAAYIADTAQIGLPTDYYADSPQTAPVQKAFKDFLAGALKFIGETDNLDARAAAVYDMYKSAAQAQIPAARQNDPGVIYTPADWAVINPLIAHWNGMTAEQLAAAQKMNIYCADMNYVKYVNGLFTEENLPVLKDIAELDVLDTFASFLGDGFLDLQSAIQTAITGAAPARDDMSVRAQGVVEALMGGAVSNLYAAGYGTAKVKDDMTRMVETIRQKRIDLIGGLDWMTADTKAKAVDKLKSITAYVAYPDKPADGVSFDVTAKSDGGSLVGLYMNFAKAGTDKLTAELQKPVDQNMWNFVPTYTVNAYYSASVNGIVIPIGILQAPFYDPAASEAENLGAIGAVIAHEFTHSVDNSGAQYDKNGTLTNWWSDADYTAFAAKTKLLSDALSKITFAGAQLNGPLIVGEQIADLGGLSAALSVAQDEGLDTGAVMTSWARLWRDRMPSQMASLYLSVDVHPPAKLRGNFALSQQDEFYRVFGIQPGDGMYTAPEDRINIW
ncbi:MAG: M13 family metallopeptidase [Firmicutes bacterium]|nr:M13 family metallopeptidase [Bacillota bacterium]